MHELFQRFPSSLFKCQHAKTKTTTKLHDPAYMKNSLCAERVKLTVRASVCRSQRQTFRSMTQPPPPPPPGRSQSQSGSPVHPVLSDNRPSASIRNAEWDIWPMSDNRYQINSRSPLSFFRPVISSLAQTDFSFYLDWYVINFSSDESRRRLQKTCRSDY